MGIFGGKVNTGKLVSSGLSLIDNSTLTSQEKADKTVDYLERTNSTPSSKSRRFVAKFLLFFIASMTLVIIGLYKVDIKWAMFAKDQMVDFSNNHLVLSVTAIFMSGYYIKNTVTERQRIKLKQGQAEHEAKMKEKEVELEKESRKNDLSLSRREDRRSRRRERRGR